MVNILLPNQDMAICLSTNNVSVGIDMETANLAVGNGKSLLGMDFELSIL